MEGITFHLFLGLLWTQFALTVCDARTSFAIYSYREVASISDPSNWVEIQVSIVDQIAHATLLNKSLPVPSVVNEAVPLTNFVMKPVYMSLTTIDSRFSAMKTTIVNILEGLVVPTKIFLIVSKDPFLLDKGVTHIPDDLLCFVAAGYLNIVFVPNHGPHRKLLPVLRKFWNEDVYIVTVDDDAPRSIMRNSLHHLLSTYQKSNYTDAVVALRTRRIAICDKPPHNSLLYVKWPILVGSSKIEMLLLPTGTGGIMYRPRHFHEVVFDPLFRNATRTADDLMFRLATMMMNVPILVGCGGPNNLCSYNTTISTAIAISEPSIPKEHNHLYKMNTWYGGNDVAWKNALEFLKPLGFDFAAFARNYSHERGKPCNHVVPSKATSRCGLYTC